MSYKSCSRSPDKDGTCYQSISRNKKLLRLQNLQILRIFFKKGLGDEGSQTISEAHFFAATMQKFGVKPAVYSLTKTHLKATHCHLTAKVSHAGLLKHENSL